MTKHYASNLIGIKELDLILAQALDIYSDMEPEKAIKCAKAEWSPSPAIASLLVCKLQTLQARRPDFTPRHPSRDG